MAWKTYGYGCLHIVDVYFLLALISFWTIRWMAREIKRLCYVSLVSGYSSLYPKISLETTGFPLSNVDMV